MEYDRSRLGSLQVIARTAAFVAVGVVSGLALAGIPNVELVTATCFVSGHLLGVSAGFMTGIIVEFVFAGFHPMGSSMGILLFSQALGMSIAGAVGGLTAGLVASGSSTRRAFLLSALGFAVTLIFDLLTNLAYPLAAGFSFAQLGFYLIAGIPFAIIHIGSNVLVFALLVAPLIPRLRRVLTPL